MSIIRIGLSETDKFGEGYDAIFAKGKRKPTKQSKTHSKLKQAKAKKKAKKK